MAILIGHASIDENNRAKNGKAGDQTRKEVCTRSWYSKPWDFALRCKDAGKAEKMAVACEKGCANENIGYDQNQRNTLNTQAKAVGYDLSKITVPCETDCSAFMTVCAQAAGINVPYNSGNAPTTSTMKNAFSATGEFEVLTDKKYLTSDEYLKRGDILVKAGSHTVMALSNGSKAVTEKTGVINPYSEPTRILKLKPVQMRGEDVKWIQFHLVRLGFLPKNDSKGKSNIDGAFGKNTQMAVINAQARYNIEVDGVVGKITRYILKTR